MGSLCGLSGVASFPLVMMKVLTLYETSSDISLVGREKSYSLLLGQSGNSGTLIGLFKTSPVVVLEIFITDFRG